ncbi:MAG: right-handed parallel beta-helix repeat-containing protein [Nannocystaceae bacterium]
MSPIARRDAALPALAAPLALTALALAPLALAPLLLSALACGPSPATSDSAGDASATASTTDASSSGTSGAASTDASASTSAASTGAATTSGPGTTTSDASTATDTADPTDTADTTGAPTIPPECDGIPPSADPADNHARILECLTTHGAVRLAPGVFPIDAEIDMPDGARLLGDDTWPTIQMVADAQSLVRTHTDDEVAFLRLDGNHHMVVAHNAIVRLMGDDSFVHDCHVQNADGPKGDDKVTGVRFWTVEARGNRVFRNQIHHVHYGVIFDLFPAGADNLLEDNQIYETRCDGVTFRGYGRAHGNHIYRVGWQCLNPPEDPIPGGCFYTLDNDAGAEIVDNHAHQACGMPLDLDSAAGLHIEGNTFEEPGYVWDGHNNCGAGITAHLLGIRESTIVGNTFRNNGPGTVKSDPNHVMSANGSGAPSDLPSGASQAVAFALTHREGGALATHNTIEDNAFIANCPQPCVGLGYFVGRGTGYTNDKQWSASTTNYFRRNTPFGSNIGSKRCGGGWYAADSKCEEGTLDAECNADDPQHQGPGHDWARNDECPFYQ